MAYYTDLHGWVREGQPRTWEERFGLRVKVARIERGWTQQELANRLGVSKDTVYRWESGQRLPSLPLAAALAVLVGQPLGELVKG